MHELAIVEGIMAAAIPAAEETGAKRILAIRLRIGELSGVIPECIQAYFAIAAQGTMAQEASIEVERIPVTIRCRGCGFEGELGRRRMRCPRCEGVDFKLLSGREYYVDSLEVE